MSQQSALCGELNSIRHDTHDIRTRLASHDTRLSRIEKTLARIELNTRGIHTGLQNIHDEVVRQQTLLQRVAQYLTFRR
jgi:chromosome segregation ATPase